MLNRDDLILRLEVLRKRWKNEPANREIIERQGKALKIALEDKKTATFAEAKEILQG